MDSQDHDHDPTVRILPRKTGTARHLPRHVLFHGIGMNIRKMLVMTEVKLMMMMMMIVEVDSLFSRVTLAKLFTSPNPCLLCDAWLSCHYAAETRPPRLINSTSILIAPTPTSDAIPFPAGLLCMSRKFENRKPHSMVKIAESGTLDVRRNPVWAKIERECSLILLLYPYGFPESFSTAKPADDSANADWARQRTGAEKLFWWRNLHHASRIVLLQLVS